MVDPSTAHPPATTQMLLWVAALAGDYIGTLVAGTNFRHDTTHRHVHEATDASQLWDSFWYFASRSSSPPQR